MFRVAAALAVLMSATVANAADIPLPDIDPRANCDRAARLDGDFDRATMLVCMEQEQQSYDTLKAKWASYPAAARQACRNEPSYQFVVFCIGRETQAAVDLDQFEFRR